MSGMDRLTDSELEAMLGYDLHDARGELCRTSDFEDQSWGMSIAACSIVDTDAVVKAMARELLAHRRASQAAPAPSDGLREAVDAAWNDAIEAAAEKCDVASMDHIGDIVRGIGDDIRALRRADPTEGEA